MINRVGFPGLNLDFELNRVAFSLFGKNIYWYALIIVTGLLLATLFGIYEGKRVGLPKDTILDILLIGTPSAIICARLYFVISNYTDYIHSPFSIIKIWEGGIAIYGAIIGAVVSAYIYCKVKKLNVALVFDVCCIGLLIGQIVGRWGNFVNAEAYGSITDLPWRMEIFSRELGETVCVHPTFLYESLWNFIGFIGILIYRKHKKFNGEIFLLYITWYGLGRMWIEQLRVDSLPYNASFKISQIVAVITAIIGIYFIIKNRKKEKEKE